MCRVTRSRFSRKYPDADIFSARFAAYARHERRIDLGMQHRTKHRFMQTLLLGTFVLTGAALSACEVQQRRVDVPEPSGADESIDSRFGLTADAQDPQERDKELGYGRWKAKPEPEGTRAPTSPTRRGSWGTGG